MARRLVHFVAGDRRRCPHAAGGNVTSVDSLVTCSRCKVNAWDWLQWDLAVKAQEEREALASIPTLCPDCGRNMDLGEPHTEACDLAEDDEDDAGDVEGSNNG